jgi:hypothetical protein
MHSRISFCHSTISTGSVDELSHLHNEAKVGWRIVHLNVSESACIRALADYKDFLTLSKDADPDLPILKEAKAEYAEYAKLR